MTHDPGFQAEIFSQRNYRILWNELERERSRCIRLWLFAKPLLRRHGFCWDRRLKKQSELLEQLMIMHARAAGHTLINTMKMRAAEGIAVEGLFGANCRGRRSSAVETLSEALALG